MSWLSLAPLPHHDLVNQSRRDPRKVVVSRVTVTDSRFVAIHDFVLVFLVVVVVLRVLLRKQAVADKLRMPSGLLFLSIGVFALILLADAVLPEEFWSGAKNIVSILAFFVLALAAVLAMGVAVFDLFLGRYRKVLVSKIVRDVQELAMAMRMIPVGPTFQKMARLVRDVSRKVNKQVQLTISGEDTELDKNVIQQIGDPLVHMLRNAVDHGIESAEARKAAGKSPVGQIHLSAGHHGGNIVIEITDLLVPNKLQLCVLQIMLGRHLQRVREVAADAIGDHTQFCHCSLL